MQAKGCMKSIHICKNNVCKNNICETIIELMKSASIDVLATAGSACWQLATSC